MLFFQRKPPKKKEPKLDPIRAKPEIKPSKFPWNLNGYTTVIIPIAVFKDDANDINLYCAKTYVTIIIT